MAHLCQAEESFRAYCWRAESQKCLELPSVDLGSGCCPKVFGATSHFGGAQRYQAVRSAESSLLRALLDKVELLAGPVVQRSIALKAALGSDCFADMYLAPGSFAADNCLAAGRRRFDFGENCFPYYFAAETDYCFPESCCTGDRLPVLVD